MIRDGAYKIRARAEVEREAHKKKGAWDDPAGNAPQFLETKRKER